MQRPIIIWGARGYAKVLRELVEALDSRLLAVFDNDPRVPAPFADVPLIYGTDGFERWQSQQSGSPVAGLVAIGGARGRERLEMQRWLQARGVKPFAAIHPTSFVAPDVVMGTGCQVLAHATICPDVKMGEACMINTASTVDHECALGDGVHVAPGATLTGCVSVGNFTMIGAGAVVLPRMRIGANVTVGAGAVVTKDIPDHHVVCGNPARFLRVNVEQGAPARTG